MSLWRHVQRSHWDLVWEGIMEVDRGGSGQSLWPVEPLKRKVVLPCTSFQWASQDILLLPSELNEEIFTASRKTIWGHPIGPMGTFRGWRWCSCTSTEPTVGGWEQTKVCFQAKESGSNWHWRDGGLMAYIYYHLLTSLTVEKDHRWRMAWEMLQVGEKMDSKSDQIDIYCCVHIRMYTV